MSTNELIKAVEKAHGKGSLMFLGQNATMEYEGISTGSLALDIVLGGKGFPRGRIVEVYGPESSGKTTLALHAIAQAQLNGLGALFVDAEHALDPSWASKIGVNVDELLVSQPNSGEQALQIAEMAIKSGNVGIVVVDSVSALVPQAELNGEIGDTHVGLQARMMGQAMRKLTASISQHNCLLIFINQIREKIGVMFGSPETTSGGRALRFFASQRIDVRKGKWVKEGEEVIGQIMRCKTVKNKMAPPFKVVEFDLMHDRGFSVEADVFNTAVKNEVIARSGAWYSYTPMDGEEVRIQGKSKWLDRLAADEDLLNELKSSVIDTMEGSTEIE